MMQATLPMHKDVQHGPISLQEEKQGHVSDSLVHLQ